jgi:DNA-binding MarR family transcriptional regulator
MARLSKPPADRSAVMLFSDVFDALVEAMHDSLPAAGFDDIRPSHSVGVLRTVDPQGTRPGELARRAGVTPQAMAEFVRYLEERGYVERVPDATDGRARLVRLTSRGHEAAKAAHVAFDAIESDWKRRLGERRYRELKQMLAELRAPRAVRSVRRPRAAKAPTPSRARTRSPRSG